MSENDPEKIKQLLQGFRDAKLFIISLTNWATKESLLCINRIGLSGIKSENAGDQSIPEEMRPKGNPAVDTYHWLRFTLRRDVGTEADWDSLLSRPSFSIPSSVTLRLHAGTDTYDLPTAVVRDAPDPRCQFFLAGMRYFPFWTIVIAIVIVIAVFWRFAGTTDLIRDVDGALRPDGRRPFSLAKSQMAMWFFLILGAFAFLWAATGRLTTLNDTCLWLIGIGSGTALGAAVIAVGHDLSQKERYPVTFNYKMSDNEIRAGLEKRLQDAKDKLTGLPETATEAERATAQADIDALKSQLDDFNSMSNRGWWRVLEDWLCENGSDRTWSFHRFQMLGWTLVLGLVFFVKVASERNIPEFNTQLLALMGISAGTYIGFKLPAQKQIERKNQSDT